MSETSVKIIGNERRCRDDTVPKTVDTRRHCKVWLVSTVFGTVSSLHLISFLMIFTLVYNYASHTRTYISTASFAEMPQDMNAMP